MLQLLITKIFTKTENIFQLCHKAMATLILTTSDTEVFSCTVCLSIVKLCGTKSTFWTNPHILRQTWFISTTRSFPSKDSSQSPPNNLSDVSWKMGWTTTPVRITSAVIMRCAKKRIKLQTPFLYCSRETLISNSHLKKFKRSKKETLYDHDSTECMQKMW